MGAHAVCRAQMVCLIFFIYLDVILSMIEWLHHPSGPAQSPIPKSDRRSGVSEVYLSFIDWASSEQAASSKYRTRGSEVQEGRREYSGPSMNTLVKMLIF